MIKDICQKKGVPVPPYIQVQGKDIEILKLACKTGRMPGVTYSFSPSGRYGGQKIAHMVSLPHADDKWFCVLDNNFPRTYEWLTPQEFSRTYAPGSGGHLSTAAHLPCLKTDTPHRERLANNHPLLLKGEKMKALLLALCIALCIGCGKQVCKPCHPDPVIEPDNKPLPKPYPQPRPCPCPKGDDD